MNWKIPLFKIYSDQNDIEAVSTVIKRDAYWTNGPEVEELEKSVAEFIGVKHAVAFNSGTSALHAALLAYNVKGGEVVVPTFSFVSTASTIVLAGAKPIFAESEPKTFGLDVNDVRSKVSDRTKAIILVHYAGCPAKYSEEIKNLCEEKNITLIEDAAEALGSSKNGRKVGTFGNTAMFSFCQNKTITSGEGGLIVTDSDQIKQKLRLLRSHGRDDEKNYFSNMNDGDCIELGYNYRMPTITAALALSQFKKIDIIIKTRNEHAAFLNKELDKVKGINVPMVNDNTVHTYQMYTIRLENKDTRDALQKFLAEKKIMSKIYFNPIHLKTYYKKLGYGKGDLPKTEALSDCVLTLPLFVSLTHEDVQYMVAVIKEFFKRSQ